MAISLVSGFVAAIVEPGRNGHKPRRRRSRAARLALGSLGLLVVASCAKRVDHDVHLNDVVPTLRTALSPRVPVTVITSNYTSRPVPEAERLADAIRIELDRLGYSVVTSPVAADPIVVELRAWRGEDTVHVRGEVTSGDEVWLDHEIADEEDPPDWVWTGLRLPLSPPPLAIVGVRLDDQAWLVAADEAGATAFRLHPGASDEVRTSRRVWWTDIVGGGNGSEFESRITSSLRRDRDPIASIRIEASGGRADLRFYVSSLPDEGAVHAVLTPTRFDCVGVIVRGNARAGRRASAGGFYLGSAFLTDTVLRGAVSLGRTGAIAALTLDGRLLAGDERGQWEAPRPGPGVGIAACGEGFVIGRNADGEVTTALSIVSVAGRRLEFGDEIEAPGPLCALTSLDLDGDGREEILVATRHGNEAQLSGYRKTR